MTVDMISRVLYTNGNDTTEVTQTRYTNGSETWFFAIGEKEYFYQKPFYARERLDKLGYKYANHISSKCV